LHLGFIIMPELPEIETIVKGAKEKLKGRTIKGVDVRIPRMVNLSLPKFKKEIEGAKIVAARRAGKIIILDLANKNSILIHLKLTGQLVYQVSDERKKEKRKSVGGHPSRAYEQSLPHKHTHLIFHLDKGNLYFNDLRKFGWLKVVPSKKLSQLKEIKELGPDPLDKKKFSLAYFKERLKRRGRSKIKQVLMDQKFVSGIGNIYANEILFAARIRPDRVISSLKEKEIKAIYKAISKILEKGIELGGSSENTYVNIEGRKGNFMDFARVYQRRGESCKRKDGGKIKRIVIGGRSSFFCPKCQS